MRPTAWGSACLLAIVSSLGSALAQPAHTIEELMRAPQIRDAALSPDGTRIALVRHINAETADAVLVVESAKAGEPGAFKAFGLGDEKISIEWVEWATNDRLLAAVSSVSPKDVFKIPNHRVIAMDPDGTHAAILFQGSSRITRESYNLSRVISMHGGEPNTIMMPAWTGGTYDLFRVNVLTGAATRVVEGNSHTFNWEVEDGQPVLRYDSNWRRNAVTVYGRAGADRWQALVKYRESDEELREWEYAGDAPGAGKIYVRTRAPGADKAEIHLFDLATRTMGESIASADRYDMRSGLNFGDRYAGAYYLADRVTYVLKDPKLQNHIDALNRYFAKGANVWIVYVNDAQSVMLLYVSGPQDPGDYYVYDVAHSDLKLVRASRPWLVPERLARVEVRHTRTRDGGNVDSYLTIPSADATGPRPLVVMPHGGPRWRDSLRFDLTAQVLAAQGWLVLQPNFRGSNGYGRAFEEAGHREWAKRMQDDVTDCVQDLVSANIADPKRIAIYGASYGGYAALAGAMVTPDLYRAAVSVAGVSDLEQMLKWEKRQKDDDEYDYWVKNIGDPKADAGAINAASPALNVYKIKIPILLIHGEDDGIVPIEQSKIMQRALEQAHKTVRLLSIKGEGHGGWSREHERQQLEETIAFLKPFLE